MNGGSLAGWPEDGVLRILFGTRFSTSRNAQGLEGRLDWQRTHDLLRGLDLSTLRSKRRVLFGSVEPADSETLAWVSGEALILLSKQHSFLWLGVSLADSNLSTQPFLPLLCIRALAALLPSAGKATLTALLDPVESDIAATKPLPRADTPRFYRPPRAYWPWLLAAAMCLLLLRAVLFPTALFPSSSI